MTATVRMKVRSTWSWTTPTQAPSHKLKLATPRRTELLMMHPMTMTMIMRLTRLTSLLSRPHHLHRVVPNHPIQAHQQPTRTANDSDNDNGMNTNINRNLNLNMNIGRGPSRGISGTTHPNTESLCTGSALHTRIVLKAEN